MIDEYTYGKFIVDGKEFLGDIKIINNVVHYWQTRKSRELKMEHLKEFFDKKPDMIIIGTGAGGLLEVSDDMRKYIYENIPRIQMFIGKNTDAITQYNKHEENGKKICALFPSSC